MITSVTIGKLGLEGLMDRANIAFTNGYRFKGAIDKHHLQASIQAVCNSIVKFEHQVHFISQDNYTWQKSSQRDYPLQLVTTTDLDEAFVIGGATLYEVALELADRLYITEIQQEFEGDTWFPIIDKQQWQEVTREDIKDESVTFNYSFIIYARQ